jgi:hypothetical protein
VASALRTLAAFLAEHWAKVVGYALVPLAALATAWIADNPWPLAWLLAPVVLLESVPAWRWLRSEPDDAKPLALGSAMGWTLGVFALAYLVVAGTNVCASPEPLVGCDDAALPRNWLGTASLAGKLPRSGAGGWLRDALSGDWRYAVADGPRASGDLLVVLIEPWPAGTTVTQVRKDLANLVVIAHRRGARGLAFDLYFQGVTDADVLLAKAIRDARTATPETPRPMPVFFGTAFKDVLGELVRWPEPPPKLVDGTILHGGEGPLRDQDEGHLVPYPEADGVIRSVPLGFGRRTWIPPLSVRIARYLPAMRVDVGATPGPAPKDTEDPRSAALLQFPAPAGGVQTVPFADLRDRPETRSLLDRRFVLVGMGGPVDRHETPFSAEKIPGVLLHAYAVESLGSGTRIHRVPWWVSVLGLLYPCLSLAGRAVRGDRARKLVLSALAVSALFVVTAALAMHLSLLWISTLEGLVGLWLFVPLAILVRKRAKPPHRFRPVLEG